MKVKAVYLLDEETMELFHAITTVKNNGITFDGLEQYDGQSVEVIVRTVETRPLSLTNRDLESISVWDTASIAEFESIQKDMKSWRTPAV